MLKPINLKTYQAFIRSLRLYPIQNPSFDFTSVLSVFSVDNKALKIFFLSTEDTEDTEKIHHSLSPVLTCVGILPSTKSTTVAANLIASSTSLMSGSSVSPG